MILHRSYDYINLMRYFILYHLLILLTKAIVIDQIIGLIEPEHDIMINVSNLKDG